MDEIFQINYVLNNEITKIFVFVGNDDINYEKELKDVMTNNKKKSVINTIFTNEKINSIKDNKIQIVFVNLHDVFHIRHGDRFLRCPNLFK